MIPFNLPPCTPDHYSQPKNMICLNSTCLQNSLLCSHCLFRHHNDHKYCPIQYYSEKHLQMFDQHASNVKPIGIQLRNLRNSLCDSLDSMINSLQKIVENIKTQIQEAFYPMVNAFSESSHEKQVKKLKNSLTQKTITQQLKKIKILNLVKKNSNMNEIKSKLSDFLQKNALIIQELAKDTQKKLKLFSTNIRFEKISGLFKLEYSNKRRNKQSGLEGSSKEESKLDISSSRSFESLNGKLNLSRFGENPELQLEKERDLEMSPIPNFRSEQFMRDETQEICEVIDHRKSNSKEYEYLFKISQQKKWYSAKEVPDFKNQIDAYWKKK